MSRRFQAPSQLRIFKILIFALSLVLPFTSVLSPAANAYSITAGVTPSPDKAWWGVAYGAGKFVAVGISGTGNFVMTSTDGINWEKQTAASDRDWYGITYGNGLFVAVAFSGDVNRVMTSPDGITWTSRNAKSGINWSSIAYGGGKFVTLSNTGTNMRVLTSIDGENWDLGTVATANALNAWYSITYGNGLFVAVSNNGGTDRVITSPDGITWTAQTTPNNNWYSVTYGNGLFVAVAQTGTLNRVMTSPDGINWTSQTTPVDSNWNSVTYGNGLFVAVANNGAGHRLMTSTDGITWTAEASNPTNGNWNAVTYGDRKFVAVSQNGTGNRAMVISTTPPAITLSSSTGTATAGSPLTSYAITSNGGAVTSYSISPNISTTPGLTFNTSTGLISGTPTTAAAAVTYKITARNTDGLSTATYALTVTAAVIVTNNPPPPPVQISSISSCQDATGPTTGGNTYSISGSFVTPIFNVQVGNVIIPQSSWVQTPTSVTITMPANTASVVPIIIYNGQVPLLDGCKYTYVTPNSTQVSASKSVQPLASSLKLKVFFGLSSSNITSVEKIKLKSLSTKIAGLGDKITITVTGYAQPTPGSEKTDGALSKARAAAVASYLRKAGVDTNVIYAGAGRAATNTASSRYVQVVANNN